MQERERSKTLPEGDCLDILVGYPKQIHFQVAQEPGICTDMDKGYNKIFLPVVLQYQSLL